MTQHVAVTRHTLQEAPGIGGRVFNRPYGRRLLLLAAAISACLVSWVVATSARAAALPDNRGYEMVTPPNKDNSGPYLRAGVFGGDQLSVDGNAVSYGVLETFPGSPSFGGSFRATRTSGGWTDANVVPPQTNVTGLLCSINASMVGYSSDMSKGVLADGLNSASGCPKDDPVLVPGEPQGFQNLFVADPTNHTYQLVDVTPSGVTPADANYVGGSSDLSRVVFTEAAPLTSDAPGAGATDLYEWAGGTVSLVSQIPTAPAQTCSGAACTPVAGSIATATLAFHAVSGDASRVFFTANGNLYVRQNGTSTAQIDAPAAGGAGPGGGGQFVGASADGSKVFFTDGDGAGLTSDTVSGSGNNLYEYDVSTGQLTDLTPSADAEVQGFSGISDDGSFIYFVANGSLASGATAAAPNLYVNHNGTTTFIATLDNADSSDWNSSAPTARASSNGQFLVFTSIDSLTGFNNMDANTSTPDNEIFLYNATTAALSCTSCSPSGAAPTGSTNIDGGQVDGFTSAVTILARYVSDTGQVFFDTPNALVPADTDGAADTYEYEAGHASLISSGTDRAGAPYVDNSPDGNNVVFATTVPLVAQDTDGGAYDFYDARVGGGFPASSPTPACQGDSCKPPQSNPVPVQVPGSSTFTGPTNAKSSHAAPKITLVKRTVTSAKFALHLRVTGSGKITVSGASIKRASRSVRHAGTYAVMVHLTNKAKNRLKHKRKLKLSIRAQYVPSAGSASTVNANVSAKA